jgi:hypothetical protein
MPNFIPKNIMSLMIAIAATGALLNLANKGTLGAQAKSVSKYITEGFGAGAIN